MKEIIQDKNGKICNAKIIYNICTITTLFTCCAKIIISDGNIDYSGMGVLIGAVVSATGAVYWGRNKTKENVINV